MREKGIQFFKFRGALSLSLRILSVILLVLIATSIANATLQISVNGNKNPVDSEIVLLPSDTLSLDVWTDSAISPGAGEWAGWAMVVDPSKGSISGGIVVPPYDTDPGITIDDLGILAIYPPLWPENGVGGSIILTVIPNIPPGDIIFDEIQFHCEGLGDAEILLYGTTDYVEFILQDTVIIHQIPEPATFFLLGLGVVAIKQKRR